MRILEVDSNHEICIQKLKKIINSNTKIISLTYASNVLGTINPIEKIGNQLSEKNIYFIVDAAQAVPHFKIDVQKINCDFLVFFWS